MEAKINGFVVSGTPAEIAEILQIGGRQTKTENQTRLNPVMGQVRYEQPKPHKRHYKKVLGSRTWQLQEIEALRQVARDQINGTLDVVQVKRVLHNLALQMRRTNNAVNWRYHVERQKIKGAQ